MDKAEKVASSTDEVEPAEFWEGRYAQSDRVWSGNVNRVLADTVIEFTPGRALDLGCGEGADVIWLAQHGWHATGIDISPTAIARATAAAEAAELEHGRAEFLTADLTTLTGGAYDLVSASFLHSPVALERTAILRQASTLVAPGGHLLITSHADFPPWASVATSDRRRFLSPEEELAQLELDPRDWEVIHAEVRRRDTVAPGGEPASLDDVVVLVRRR